MIELEGAGFLLRAVAFGIDIIVRIILVLFFALALQFMNIGGNGEMILIYLIILPTLIFYTFLIGKPPYESKDVKSTYQRILRNEYSFPSHIPISQFARDLIASMLQTRPDKR